MNVFLNENREIRSGWKFAIYLVFFLLLWVASGIAVSIVYARTNIPDTQLTLLALNETALFIPAVGAMLLAVRFVDRRPLAAFGIGLLPRWQRDLAFGLAVAAGMLAVLIGGCYAFGYVSMRWTGRQVPAGMLLGTLLFLLAAALTEELVFRGFPLQILIDGMGRWPAIILMSTIFGAMHYPNNPNATLLSSANTVIAGILLSLAYAKTRSLWLPYSIHVGWNIGLGFVLGFPLSGFDLASLWTTGIAGSDLILGGGYGPEGGLLATFIFATAAVVVNSSTNIRPSARAYRDAGEHPPEE